MRRIILYIIALAFIGLAIAGKAELPQIVSGQLPRTETADSSAVIRSVPLDSLVINTDSITVRGDSVFYRVGSTTEVTDSISLDSIPSDSLHSARLGDPMPADSTRTRLSRINRTETDLKNSVTFEAKDSLVMVGQNNTYLYGDGNVEYGEFKLNAQEIRMELDKSTVYAEGAIDSTGNLAGNPVFNQGSDSYESKQMSYNFKTERGYITDVVTEQGEGYLTGGRSKKMEDGSYFIEDGMYTTCDNHEHPHFGLRITKGKMIPNKNVVSGPAYMVLADVPLPIALPFGYFPFKIGRAHV